MEKLPGNQKLQRKQKTRSNSDQKNGLVVACRAMNRDRSRAGAIFWRQIFLDFFRISFFLGVFKWFCLHKKVSLTTLAARGVRHGLSRAQGRLQNCQF